MNKINLNKISKCSINELLRIRELVNIELHLKMIDEFTSTPFKKLIKKRKK